MRNKTIPKTIIKAGFDIPIASNTIPEITLIRKKEDLPIITKQYILVEQRSESPLVLQPMADNGWIDDSASVCCMQCSEMFTFLFRRHHCRKYSV